MVLLIVFAVFFLWVMFLCMMVSIDGPDMEMDNSTRSFWTGFAWLGMIAGAVAYFGVL